MSALIGKQYPPARPYEVGREKIREFADAIGDQHPVYRDPAAARAHGYRDVIAPPTFGITVTLHAANAVLEDPELGVDYSRVVHGDQRFVHHRPIVAGDVLHTTVSVEDIKNVGGNLMVTTRSDVTDADGADVLTGYTAIVVRGESA